MDAMGKKCQLWIKNVWKIFTKEETSELTFKRGIEICFWSEVEGKFQWAELPCAKIWMYGKKQSIQGITLRKQKYEESIIIGNYRELGKILVKEDLPWIGLNIIQYVAIVEC